MKLYPRFKSLCRLLDKHREEVITEWAGESWRFQTLTHPTEADILNGEGARIHGGRWNTRGLFPAIYGSTSGEIAMRESEALDRYYGLVTRKARLFVCLSLRLTHVLDLTQTPHLKKLGLIQKHLDREDWRRLQDRNVESLTQCIGRAAAGLKIEALLTRSAAVKGGVNVTLFPDQIHSGSEVILNDAEAIRRIELK